MSTPDPSLLLVCEALTVVPLAVLIDPPRSLEQGRVQALVVPAVLVERAGPVEGLVATPAVSGSVALLVPGLAACSMANSHSVLNSVSQSGQIGPIVPHLGYPDLGRILGPSRAVPVRIAEVPLHVDHTALGALVLAHGIEMA